MIYISKWIGKILKGQVWKERKKWGWKSVLEAIAIKVGMLFEDGFLRLLKIQDARQTEERCRLFVILWMSLVYL